MHISSIRDYIIKPLLQCLIVASICVLSPTFMSGCRHGRRELPECLPKATVRQIYKTLEKAPKHTFHKHEQGVLEVKIDWKPISPQFSDDGSLAWIGDAHAHSPRCRSLGYAVVDLVMTITWYSEDGIQILANQVPFYSSPASMSVIGNVETGSTIYEFKGYDGANYWSFHLSKESGEDYDVDLIGLATPHPEFVSLDYHDTNDYWLIILDGKVRFFEPDKAPKLWKDNNLKSLEIPQTIR